MSVRVFYEILNQRGTPAMFTDTLANRPAFGFAGRLFISTDSGQIFEDTGSAWTLVADAGVGGGTLSSVCLNGNTTATGIVITAGGLSTNSLTNTSLTTGSILFADGGGLINQSNATFFWDNTNKRLGIGNASPGAPLDIHGTGTQMQLNGTGSNNSYIQFQNAGVSKWKVGNTYNAGANSFDIFNATTNATALSISSSNVSTFGGNILIDNGIDCQYIAFKQYGTGAIGLTPGYTSIGVISTNTFAITFDQNKSIRLNSSLLTTARGFIFPDADGTIALTSDLSAYLPLTGGTLTGTLFMNGTGSNNAYIQFQNASTSKWKIGNTYNAGANSFDIFNSVLSTSALSISNSSDVITINYKLKSEAAILIKNGATVTAAGYTGISSTVSGLLINLGNSGNNATLTFQTGADYTYTYPAATGTLALTSQLSGYLPLTGGTLTGALSGTSATFSSFNTLGNIRLSSNPTGIEFYNTSGIVRNWQISAQNINDQSLDFTPSTANGGTTYSTPILSLKGTTGAATFSSSVGIGGSFSSSRASNGLSITGSYSGITLESTGVSRKWDITANYASGTAFLEFYDETAAATRMVITSGGNLLIGTTTDNGQKLQVEGNAKFKNNVTFDTYGNLQSQYASVSASTTRTVTISGTLNGTIQIMVSMYGNGSGSQSRAMFMGGGYLGGGSLPYTEITRVNGGTTIISAITSNASSSVFTIQND